MREREGRPEAKWSFEQNKYERLGEAVKMEGTRDIIISKHLSSTKLETPCHSQNANAFQNEFWEWRLHFLGSNSVDVWLNSPMEDASGSTVYFCFFKGGTRIFALSSFLLPKMWIHWLEPWQSSWAMRWPWEEKPCTVEKPTQRFQGLCCIIVEPPY